MTSLDADQRLLRRFIGWIGLRAPDGRLHVLQQSLAGERRQTVRENEALQRGLPDGWIHDRDRWSLLVESKVAAAPNHDQIRRHLSTARRCGFEDTRLLWLTVTPVSGRMRERVINRTWCELYSFLVRECARSEWAGRVANYLEVAEVQADMKAHIRQGTLTRFAGVPFDESNVYLYSQAKRLLGLLRGELLRDRRLERRLGMNRNCPGRGAIKGSSSSSVWDFISIKASRRDDVFTQNLHLTLGISDERVDAYVTVPNGIRSRLRNALLGADYANFHAIIAETTHRLNKVLRRYPGARPCITVVQRRFATQSSPARHDAVIRFDPRTAVPVRGRTRGPIVLKQPQWLIATEQALRHRRSNLQLQVGVEFPYATCKVCRSADLTRAVADVWLACEPIVRAIDSGRSRSKSNDRNRRMRGRRSKKRVN